MAANFWKGSQCASWMLDEAVLDRAKSRDATYLSIESQAALTYFFADVIRALGDELKLRQQVSLHFPRLHLIGFALRSSLIHTRANSLSLFSLFDNLKQVPASNSVCVPAHYYWIDGSLKYAFGVLFRATVVSQMAH
eukprot:m.114917 g.114917  ORF g.114917 m.114917 type:complete len:137 (-) comp21528_c0_seq3:162-572(-)